MEELLSEKESQTIINKCPNCGAGLKYDVESGELKCDHCATIVDIDDDSRVKRRDLTSDIMQARSEWKETKVTRCDNCGGKEVLDKRDITKSCSFCGSAKVVVLSELAGIKPDSVIPFQITKENASQRFIRWIKSRLYAPNSLKRRDFNKNFNALYSSCWSFSAATQNNYEGTLGRTVTRTRRVNGRTETYTTVQWFRVSGSLAQDYKDYLVQSGDKISNKWFEKIKPFNLATLKVYRQEYLSGIVAEHYARNIDVCFGDFTKYIRRDLQNKIMRKHGADQVSQLTINTTYTDKRFNYILLPIYIANYTYKKKLYNFYVNGATGKVVGRYPKSFWKIFFTFLGIGALVAGAVGLFIAFGG